MPEFTTPLASSTADSIVASSHWLFPVFQTQYGSRDPIQSLREGNKRVSYRILRLGGGGGGTFFGDSKHVCETDVVQIMGGLGAWFPRKVLKK